MSIASEITRLQQAKADIKTAIENKGVTVPSDATLDDYADLVDSISGGGGSVDWESIARGMCDGTTSFSIPLSAGLKLSEQYWVYKRKNLTSVEIPSTNTSIPANSFRDCNALASVTIPNTVTSIGNVAFNACSLSALTIPSSVTSIGKQAFQYNTLLVEVIVEATTPPTLGTNVFNGCTRLASIYVPDASVSTYQGATNWTSFASKIKGISERPTT